MDWKLVEIAFNAGLLVAGYRQLVKAVNGLGKSFRAHKESADARFHRTAQALQYIAPKAKVEKVIDLTKD
jgi:hypothetical protein